MSENSGSALERVDWTADEITGELVHQVMWRRKISQREVGLAIGVNQGALGRKLRGERKWTLDELLAVARFLDVDVTDIMPPATYQPRPQGGGRSQVTEPDDESNVPTPRYSLAAEAVQGGDAADQANVSTPQYSLTAEAKLVDLEIWRSARPPRRTYPAPQRLADVVALRRRSAS